MLLHLDCVQSAIKRVPNAFEIELEHIIEVYVMCGHELFVLSGSVVELIRALLRNL